MAAAATPSMPSRPAAFGLCTTAVTRPTRSSARISSAIAAAIDSIRSNDRSFDDRADGLGDPPVVGGASDIVVADVHLDVQIDDEVLRLVLLAGTRAVPAARADAG